MSMYFLALIALYILEDNGVFVRDEMFTALWIVFVLKVFLVCSANASKLKE